MSFAYQLRQLRIEPALVLSPMSGVTCSAFRRLIKELNPGCLGLVVTEFISVEALTRRVQRSLDMLRFEQMERPLCVQIFGYDVDRMADAALMAQDVGADVVDINCGCPAPKVVKKGGGCELMRQPLHLARILKAVRAALSIPLTIKIRSGWDNNSRNALEIGRIAEAEGVEALAIHGRTRAQMYRGKADWEIVECLAQNLSIPVLGSGDIVDRDTALDRLRLSTAGSETSGKRVAGLLIGRAALSNPFIFSTILGKQPTSILAVAVLERYAELLSEEFQPKACVGRMKQLVSQFCRGHSWRKQLLTLNTFAEQRAMISQLGSGSRTQAAYINSEFEIGASFGLS